MTETSAETDTHAWLERLRGDLPSVRPHARSIGMMVTTGSCRARQVLDLAGVDKAKLADRLGVPGQYGQSPFAIDRGNRFERAVKRDSYAALVGLLQERGLQPEHVVVRDLKSEFPMSPRNAAGVLAKRADATRDLVLAITDGKVPNGTIVDGGALTWTFGGVGVRLETDALAWWLGGQLRVVEMKSYPIEWGQIDREKVSSLAWQTAVYVAALQDMLSSAGKDPALVATEIFLVCPKNTGFTPTLVHHNVAPQLRLLRRFQHRQADVAGWALELGDITLGGASGSAQATLAEALAALAPSYQPNCLSNCELAGYCRGCAQAAGEPTAIGVDVAHMLGSVSDVHRAEDLSTGAASPSGPDEALVAAELRRLVEIEALLGMAP